MIINQTVSGSGGWYPEIIVTADAGSTVTCSNGNKTLTTVEDNGTWTFKIPEFGTWTVEGTLGIENDSVSVTVNTVTQYNVTLIYTSIILNENTWEKIQEIAAAGTGANYWSVGDVHETTINGSIRVRTFSGVYYCFIIGFDHNSAIEGTGIHFQFGKSSLSGGDVAYFDSSYSIRGGGFFVIGSGSVTGGWVSSYIRGTCSIFYNALSADLKAVIAACTKYTDNIGSKTDTASNVTSTTDYVFLLSEFEVYGIRKYANSAEQNYQAQYAYYANGNSKSKDHFWWLRSLYLPSDCCFCLVNGSGVVSWGWTDYSYGFAPGFKVA